MKTKFHAVSEPIRKLKAIQYHLDGSHKTLSGKQSAILAGGALRDSYMGFDYLINDYDIFINNNLVLDSLCADPIELLIKKVFPKNEFAQPIFDSEYVPVSGSSKGKTKNNHDENGKLTGACAQIDSVWEVKEDNKTYQLILTINPPILHVEKYFDLGICKVYCDGQRIRYTNDFLTDVKNKTMTIVGNDMTEEQVNYAIDHHVAKLNYKYPGYRVVVPERYQHFVKSQVSKKC